MRRRLFIASPPLLALAGIADAALAPTPPQSAGPFYPERLPLEHDNDLVRVAGAPRPARGTPLHLVGRVLDTHGRALSGALVEIWQCDAGGRYRHPRDRGPAPDPGFQGYGRTRTDGQGGYRFRTIRPVPYPGRTPHVHFAITARGAAPLVTQMYLRGEALNERDGLFTRIPAPLRERVLITLQAGSGAELSGRFDIVVPA